MKIILLASVLALTSLTANAQRQALFVTSAAGNNTDTAVQARLAELGYTVTRVTDTASQTSDANGKDLIVISSSVNSGNVNIKFRDITVPIINWEQALQDDFDWTPAAGGTAGSQTQINIVDAAHPLAAGLPAGNNTVFTTPRPISWGQNPAASAQIVARPANNAAQVCVYAFETGAAVLNGRTAMSRRMQFYFENDGAQNLTAAGQALFDAAIEWLVPSGPAGFRSHPVSMTVIEARPVTFRVGVTGAPPISIQWHRDGAPIDDATNSSYAIAQVRLADSGAVFHATAVNALGGDTSSNAVLTVLADDAAPRLLSAQANESFFDILIRFDEVVSAETAGNPANYQIDGGLSIASATVAADGSNVVLRTATPQQEATTYTLTINGIRDISSASNQIAANTQMSFTTFRVQTGYLRRQIYTGFGGVLVADLTNNAAYPDNPTAVNLITTFEGPLNVLDNYGTRISGYVIPPVSGDYRFFIATDDQGALFLSTDENPANKTQIAFEPVWNAFRDWTGVTRRNATTPENQSALIPLVAGQRYFIEALMKEGGGGDNIAVTWQAPGEATPTQFAPSAITSGYIAAASPAATVTITEQPQSVSTFENRTATFRVAASVTPANLLPIYQWQRDGVDIPGANRARYTTPLLATTDDGARYRCVVTVAGGSATSAEAIVSVAEDTIPPTVESVAGVSNTVAICFSELIDNSDMSASDTFSYLVYIDGELVSVTNVVFRSDGKSVVLTLGPVNFGDPAPTVDGKSFQVRVSFAIHDPAGNFVAEDPEMPTFSAATAGIHSLPFVDIAGPVPAGTVVTCNNRDFTVTAGGADVWGTSDQFTYVYIFKTNDFDVKVRVDRLDLAVGGGNRWSKAGLNIRETLDGGPTPPASRMVWIYPTPTNLNTTPTGANAFEFAIRHNPGVGVTDINAVSGVPRHPVNEFPVWVRVKRFGTTFTGFYSRDGQNWVRYGNPQSSPGFPDVLYVGLGTVSHVQGTPTTAEYGDFGDFAYTNVSITITQQPVATTVTAGSNATFSVGVEISGAPAFELSYQWQRQPAAGGGFVNINGANGPSYSAVVSGDENGDQFRVLVHAPGAPTLASDAATVTVQPAESVPPTLVSATRGCLELTRVTVVFNEPVGPVSSQAAANYTINNGVSVLSATRSASSLNTVVLTTSTIADGNNYTLTVNGVRDVSGNPIAPNSQVDITLIGPWLPSGPQNLVVIEAENADGTLSQSGQSWVFSPTPVGAGPFSGSGYMRALPELGRAINEPNHITQSPRMDFCISFPVAGTWYAWLRGNDITTGANSVHIGLDNASPDVNNWRIGNSGGATGWGNPAGPASPWQWTRDADINTRVAWVNVPTAGKHVFNVWMREDSVIVDKVLLTTDPEFVLSPNTQIGPAESERAFVGATVRLTISRVADDVVITWDNPSAQLEAVDDLTGNWNVITGAASGYRVRAEEARKFYRAVVP